MNQAQKDQISSAALVATIDRLEPSARERVLTAFDRATDVEALDAWAREDDERYWVCGPRYFGKSWYCTLWHVENKREAGPFQGPTPDAARHAAAEWVRQQAKHAPPLRTPDESDQQSGTLTDVSTTGSVEAIGRAAIKKADRILEAHARGRSKPVR